MKRLFDIAFSLAVLLFGLPLFLLIALLIKLTSPGPILYPSWRLGQGGRPIRFWKFRTMCANADQKLAELLLDPKYKTQWESHFKLRNDPRLTPIGPFLRSTSLDELPQFWNVLVGEMSVVGPRPFLLREKKALRDVLGQNTAKILSVRPGITGIWQTSGRSTLTFSERLQIDLSYPEKSSLAFDLRIILKTIRILLFPHGAY